MEKTKAKKSFKKEKKLQPIVNEQDTNTENLKQQEKNKIPVEKQRINLEDIFKDIDAKDYCIDVKREYKRNKEVVKKKLKLDTNQLQSAVTLLKKQIETKFSKNTNIFLRKEDEFIYLNFVFSKLPNSYSLRPVPIKIPQSIYGDSTKVCIIVKDPKSDFKDLELKFPFTCKVISIEKLKQNYDRFNQRRELVKSYDMFICDTKVYLLLKRLLGKPFFDTKKFPIPITMDYSQKEELHANIVDVINKKTIFYMNSGPNYTVKFARAVMEDEDIVTNAVVTAKRVIPHILKWGIEFKDLKSISMKTTDSLDLPVFNQLSVEEVLTYLDKI